ncbi:alpha/beta-hydrolase [Hortaea werneckii]|nr:alpha/beta-hydrolase [Hortaea werneckii]KAI7579684.1 alpha/beta-hydrolase [Hortaea werneckii]
MPFNTLSVATAVTPSVIETYFSHYFNRGPLKQKPTAHISYHEGLRLIRRFLDYSSQHTVEDLQAFTAQWVPVPTWVRTVESEVAPQFLERAARLIQEHLGRRGVEKIGGGTWWQWRRPESPLKAEWIEMKKDLSERQRAGTKVERVILYVHGGAYYFGSVDEHRYQIQRHARKLKARVLAPKYRLAPQFPFPCGLYDCIATYLYLLQHFKPEQILFGGDSAGGGMVLSMLVVLRDQGCPLPAGTILLSPWVDLTHSFPSVAGDGDLDYIPPHGFHHKPSMAWPPPPTDEVKAARKTSEQPAYDALEMPDTSVNVSAQARQSLADKSKVPGTGNNMNIMLDGKEVEMKDQFQMYAPNELLSHPLVSPVTQPSLGGLPPMLIQVGGGELLRDEQIYLAHKAANPRAYPPSDAIMNEYDPRRIHIDHYPPTDVQLQVWEDLCHVPHTLSFTRPAKYMYRSVAQFGAWALAHAQHKAIEIQNDDAVSIISEGPDDGDPDANKGDSLRKTASKSSNQHGKGAPDPEPAGAVGKAGDPLPPFVNHMIRQRVTRHGIIFPLAPESELACLALDPVSIGQIKAGPVRKWLAKRKENDVRFANDKRKLQKKRAKELAAGYDDLQGETPPPTALVTRRRKGVAPEEKKRGRSWGLAMWSGWGSHHDEQTLDREGKVESRQPSSANDRTVHNRDENAPPPSRAGQTSSSASIARKGRRTSGSSFFASPWARDGRPQSPLRQVNDLGQAGNNSPISPLAHPASATIPGSRRSSTSTSLFTSRPVSTVVPTTSTISPDSEKIPGSQNTFLDPNNARPHNGVVAYPFKLRSPGAPSNLSTATLESTGASVPSSAASTAPVEMPGSGHEAEMPTPANETSAQELEPRSAVNGGGMTGDTGREPAFMTPSESPGGELAPMLTAPEEARASPGPSEYTTSTHQDPVFSNRTSVFGAVGADGMPIMPLLGSVSTDEKPSSPEDAQGALEGVPPLPPLPSKEEPAGVSPMEETHDSPFKIRNPVQDSRLAIAEDRPRPDSVTVSPPYSPSSASPSSKTQQQPGERSEATKNAPFRLRHAVTDPKVSSVRTPSADAAAAPPTPPPKDDGSPHSRKPSAAAETIANRAMTPIERPSESELPPNANVVMPTVVPRRPYHHYQQQQRSRETSSSPPQPPPKDGDGEADVGYKTRSGMTSELGGREKLHDRKLRGVDRKSSPPPPQQQQQTSLPRSKFCTDAPPSPQPPVVVDELPLEGAGEKRDG